jgi:hypothetical protein
LVRVPFLTQLGSEMARRAEAAREFVMVWEYLVMSHGQLYALRDPRLQAARRRYLLSCGERTIGTSH